MYTYQDFKKESNLENAINAAINNHINSDMYKTAVIADKYDKKQNVTITEYVRTIFNLVGTPVLDYTVSNNKICSNFFHRLNTQRCNYLVGNGVSFTDHIEVSKNEDGVETSIDTTKRVLGIKFDTALKKIVYKALIHGVCFGYWDVDKVYCFPLTEFVPLWDEDNGALRAGIRFWRIDKNKPMKVVLYEEDGYTKFSSSDATGLNLEVTQEKKPYKTEIASSKDGGEDVIGFSNYPTIPVIPLWGSDLKQSTLVGMREQIDSFDLIRSGFANDLTDCAEIYWIVENCGGMNESDLARFRDRLKIQHIAVADTENSSVRPYTQDIPYNARKEYLSEIRSGIYEDFGGLDVHAVAAGATNDHIDAAYQPMDEEADDLEYQVIEFVQGILELIGIEDTPIFKRNRISNQSEQTQMILSASDYMDEETILNKLPFVSVDEVKNILVKLKEDSMSNFTVEEELDA